MITERDLNSAIAECQGRKNPDAKTCMMLAAFYTIKREMYGEPEPSYSYAPPPENVIEISSGTKFARTINGRKQDDVLPVVDELMDTLQVIQPRLYDAVMDRLK
jgi:hypothetical protein